MTDTSIIASGRQVGKDSYIFFTLRGGKRLQHAMDFEEIVSDFATDFFGPGKLLG